jgi:hypothetical protein
VLPLKVTLVSGERLAGLGRPLKRLAHPVELALVAGHHRERLRGGGDQLLLLG